MKNKKKTTIDLTTNKSICILPFIHVAIFGNRIKPCCRFWTHSKYVNDLNNYLDGAYTLEEIFFCPDYNQLRQDMLDGNKINGCHKCYREEKAGSESMRQSSYDLYKSLFYAFDEPKLKFFEIGFSNLCNSSCRTCSSALSTHWQKDDKILAKKYNRSFFPSRRLNDLVIINDKDLSNLKFVKFVGGEPMLNSEFQPFLKRLINKSVSDGCRIELFSNATFFPKKEIIKSLNEYNLSRIHLSIDGYGIKNNYIRHPSKWEKIKFVSDSWLKKSQEFNNLEVQLEITASIYNIMYLEELLDWWINLNKKNYKNKCLMHIIPVFYPANMSILNVPRSLKMKWRLILRELIDKYVSYKEININLKNIYQLLSGGGRNELGNFIFFTQDLDKLRNESFASTFPELHNLIQKYL